MDNQDQSQIDSKLRETTLFDRVCEPLHREFIRIVSWNIEKGKRWELLERCLADPRIQSADVLCLNEADYGMARSGNRHVAFEIAERLNMRAVFGPAFYEFTKGVGEELAVEGENSIAVQGNAVLTRLPIVDSQNLRLPACHYPFANKEKRAGGRCVLVIRLRASAGFEFTLAVTHLEVLTTRRCRATQMRFITELLPQDLSIIAGDLNTNTFDRGSAVDTIGSFISLFRPNLKSRLTRPWEWESLFDEMKAAGFTTDQFNDCRATNHADLASLEDRKYLPQFLVSMALRRQRYLPLRLDWIACRGFRSMEPGQTITDLPAEPSDHLPITCDLIPLLRI